jgi:hypothetical protein
MRAIRKSTSQVKKLNNVLQGRFAAIYIEDVEASGYIIDSLMRFEKSFHIEEENSFLNLFISWRYLVKLNIYAYWLRTIAANYSFTEILINHNVYIESGWIASFFEEKQRSRIMHLSSVQNQPILLRSARRLWTKEIAEVSKGEKQMPFTTSELPWFDKNAIVGQNLEVTKINLRRMVVVLHAFSDANNVHIETSVLFPTYYQWAKETLSIAVNNAKIHYIFRLHPNMHKYFWYKDYSTIKKLFSDVPNNVTLHDPASDDGVSDYLLDKDEMPVIFTFKGSIALEMAIAGMRAITIGDVAAPEDTYLRACSYDDYELFLSGMFDSDCLLLDSKKISLAKEYKATLTSVLSNIL